MSSDDDVVDRHLEDRLRRTLRAVAARADEPPVGARRRSRLPLAVLVAAAVLTAGSFVAWNSLGDPGEIDRIPTEAALLHGRAAGGDEWWLIPSAVLHPPAVPSWCVAAVDLVSAGTNKPGLEWNTGGVVYGETSSQPSCSDESACLRDPARFSMGHMRTGPDDDPGSAWGYMAAVHPAVTTVEVSADGQAPFSVWTVPLPDRPDGPRFTGFTVDPGTRHVRVRMLTGDGRTVVDVTRRV